MAFDTKKLRIAATVLAFSLSISGITMVPNHPAGQSSWGIEVVEAAAILKSSDFKGLTPAKVIEKALPLAKAESQRTGIRVSIILAQFILETGWGQSEVFQNANNGFGMSERVSGNNWKGSVWDGSVYAKVNEPNVVVRKYASFNDSMRDYTNYLLNAMNGSSRRYAGLTTASTFRKAAEILVNGGYCPNPQYIESLCSLNERYNLTGYDLAQKDETLQESAAGYKAGTYVITASSLRVRKGPGTSYSRIGCYYKGTKVKVLEVRNGWGKVNFLGQTAWICLTYAKQV